MVWKPERPRGEAGGFVAAALTSVGQLRQSPNVGLWGCVRQEASVLYITNLQLQSVQSIAPPLQKLTHSLPLKSWQEREKKRICFKLL